MLDGHGGSVARTVDVTITGTNDAPVFTHTSAAHSSVAEGGSVALNIAASDVDTNASLSYTVSGLGNSTLNNGTNNHDGSYNLSAADLSGLMLTAGEGDAASLNLHVVATNTEGATSTTASADFAVIVTPVAEAPTLTAAAATVNEGGTVALNITDVLSEVDADSSLGNVIVTGVPAGVTFNHGTLVAGTLTLTPAQLSGLTMTVPDNDQGNFTLAVSATTSDGGNIATANANLAVTVNPVAEAPVISGATPDLTVTANLAPGAQSGIAVAAIYVPGSDVNLIAGDPALITTNNFAYAYQMYGSPITFETGYNYLGGHNWFVDHGINVGTLLGGTIVFANGTVGYIDAASNGAGTTESAYVYYRAYNPPATGNEDTAIPLSLNSVLSEVDPDTTLSINIAGLPAGAILSQGTLNNDGSYTLTASQLAAVALTPPAEFEGQIELLVTATATETGGNAAITTQSVAVTVHGVADTPVVSTPAAKTLNENGSVGLTGLSVSAGDISANDGLDTYTVTLGVAHGSLSVGGLHTGLTGTFLGSSIAFAGSLANVNAALVDNNITYTPTAEFQSTDTLTFSATSTEDVGTSTSSAASHTATLTVNPVAEGPLLGGATSATVSEGGLVTLGVTDSQFDADDTLSTDFRAVTIRGLPVDLTGFNGGNYDVTGQWFGTTAQFNALSFTAGEQGTYNLSISATTTGLEAGTTTEPYTLTVNPVAEGPVLGGLTSHTVGVSAGSVTLGVTDTTADSDDTLGNITITGLPHDLSSFNGGVYTASTGTWTGTATQLNALSFTAGTTTGTFNLSIAAATTGAEAATTTESYALTVRASKVLLSGSEMNSTIQSDLAVYGITSTIVSASQLQNTDFSSYTGIWLSWATTYSNTSGLLASKFSNFINAGGDVLAEEAGTNELSFLPGGSGVSRSGSGGNAVHIVNNFGALMNNVTDAGLSNWNSSFHDTFNSIGAFTGITTGNNISTQWMTIGESIGQGNLVITGLDPSFHIKFGSGATGAGSPKAQFAVNALSLGPNHTDPPVASVSDVAYGGATVDLISGDSPLLELGANASDNVAFDPASSNLVLQLDSSTTFTGQVALFAGGDTIDLRDIAFGAGTTLGYTANAAATGGTLTLSDGTNIANLALLGQYAAAGFQEAADAGGGTLITYVSPDTTQPPLTSPTA